MSAGTLGKYPLHFPEDAGDKPFWHMWCPHTKSFKCYCMSNPLRIAPKSIGGIVYLPHLGHELNTELALADLTRDKVPFRCIAASREFPKLLRAAKIYLGKRNTATIEDLAMILLPIGPRGLPDVPVVPGFPVRDNKYDAILAVLRHHRVDRTKVSEIIDAMDTTGYCQTHAGLKFTPGQIGFLKIAYALRVFFVWVYHWKKGSRVGNALKTWNNKMKEIVKEKWVEDKWRGEVDWNIDSVAPAATSLTIRAAKPAPAYASNTRQHMFTVTINTVTRAATPTAHNVKRASAPTVHNVKRGGVKFGRPSSRR